MKIAFISDIHGNSWALRAVLDDIKAKGISEIYDLGDSLYGPLDPDGAFRLLTDQKVYSICGNQDRYIFESQEEDDKNPTLRFVRDQLSKEALCWLKSLPKSRIVQDQIFLCHGIPANDSEYLLEELHNEYVGIKDFNRIEAMMMDVKQKNVVCGHSHRPSLVETPERIIINSGSVGLPAYSNDIPVPHKIENFSPMARYCILDLSKNIKVEHVAVSYDFENAAIAADMHKRPDWANWLRTGTA